MGLEELLIKTPEEMMALGERLGREAKKGDIISLSGDLGAGKTVFSKGFARGLLIDETITSPTFTILQQYDSGRLLLYHFDVYRIEDMDELLEIGFYEYINGEGVSLIEWGDKIEDILPKGFKKIVIKREENLEDHRKVYIQ